jgi:hypothetical protein
VLHDFRNRLLDQRELLTRGTKIRPIRDHALSPMAATLFTCPVTKMKVQHWLNRDDDASDNEYEAITCKACSRIHLINRKRARVALPSATPFGLSMQNAQASVSESLRGYCVNGGKTNSVLPFASDRSWIRLISRMVPT